MAFWDLRQFRYGAGTDRKLFQPEGVLQLCIPALSDAQHRHLLELLELTVGKAPYGEIIKVVHKDSANIRRQPVVRDDIDQKATIHQRREAWSSSPPWA